MSAIHLKVRDVAQAALKAYNEGRLSAQHPNTAACLYRDRDGHPCAIGAALDDDTAKRFDKLSSSGVVNLIALRMVSTDNQDKLLRLQRAHDNWATSGESHRSGLEEKFRELALELSR